MFRPRITCVPLKCHSLRPSITRDIALATQSRKSFPGRQSRSYASPLDALRSNRKAKPSPNGLTSQTDTPDANRTIDPSELSKRRATAISPERYWSQLREDVEAGLHPPVRTRFAPSPTGYLHLGSLRTAALNYVIAKSLGGQFILRIEDTDRTRIVADAEERLMADLRWAGIHWDNIAEIDHHSLPPHSSETSPICRQSDRLPLYRDHIQQLLDQDKAYRCFCTAETLEQHKAHVAAATGDTRYPQTCRGISREESRKRANDGESYVVRFKSDNGDVARTHQDGVTWTDLVFGAYRVTNDPANTSHIGEDFVLLKSDGYPTYHFANVVDDHYMKISHVIRGAEWLISTPKHVNLYRAFGWEAPRFLHVGLLVDARGQKLSKRNHDVDVSTYRNGGILPQALINWLLPPIWLGSAESKQKQKPSEKQSQPVDLDHMASLFTSVPRFMKDNARLDMIKLAATNTEHFKQLLLPGNITKAYVEENLWNPIRLYLERKKKIVPENGQIDVFPPSIFVPALTNIPSSSSPALVNAYLANFYRTIAIRKSSPYELIDNHLPLLFEIPMDYRISQLQQYVASLPTSSEPSVTDSKLVIRDLLMREQAYLQAVRDDMIRPVAEASDGIWMGESDLVDRFLAGEPQSPVPSTTSISSKLAELSTELLVPSVNEAAATDANADANANTNTGTTTTHVPPSRNHYHSVLRFALYGAHESASPSTGIMLSVLGREETMRRLSDALACYKLVLEDA